MTSSRSKHAFSVKINPGGEIKSKERAARMQQSHVCRWHRDDQIASEVMGELHCITPVQKMQAWVWNNLSCS